MKSTGKLYAGIDAGSRTTKALLWNGNEIIEKVILPTAWSPAKNALEAYQQVLERTGISKPECTVITGYGRVNADFADDSITEITAHAVGVNYLLPGTKTLIDIGGQDSKAIIISDDGIVSDFAMNDRCAAGSGKFLEFLAVTMDMKVEEFADLAESSKNPIQISSICTVFAESELLSLLAEGVSKVDIAAGVHRSIAVRVGQMAASLNPQPPVSFTGGAAKNKCLVKEISRFLNQPVRVPDFPEYAGALGAAIIAEKGI